MRKKEIVNEMDKEITHQPKLAPKTQSFSSPRRDLSKRNQMKLLKIDQQKELDVLNEVKDCTFSPKTNRRSSKLRERSSPSYVDSYLYKPKPRVDREVKDIEFDLQKSDCKFRPSLNKRGVSKLKDYIKTGELPPQTPQKSYRNSIPVYQSKIKTKERVVKERLEVTISKDQTVELVLY
jgi:hypothetical protein